MVVKKSTLEIIDDVNEQNKFKDMCGNIMLHILKCDSMDRMSKDLKMEEWQIRNNMCLMLYELKNRVGWKQYLKILFMK